MFLDIFKKKESRNFLSVDVHSHLIPNVDDGVKSWEESILLIKQFSELGFNKLITTPHVIHDYYPNTKEKIEAKVKELNARLRTEGIDVSIIAGAEYFVDEHLLKSAKSGTDLLSFGEDYILIETAFINYPVIMEELIFELKARGFKPILAHPERYSYIQEDYSFIDRLFALGVLFQINVSSLTGYYSKPAQKLAKHLINVGKVHFMGSDIHNQKHMNLYKKTVKTRLFQSCRQLNLYHDSL